MERCQRAPELNGCEMTEEWQRTIEVCEIAIDAIREQEQRKWIPVTERMPDLIPRKVGTAYSEAVNILTSERKVMKAIWDGIDWTVLFDFGEAWGEEITHWTPVLLPLPEPPKEDT
ncbi:MAG: DUF551 domain-containing protein [Faecousia sp.]